MYIYLYSYIYIYIYLMIFPNEATSTRFITIKSWGVGSLNTRGYVRHDIFIYIYIDIIMGPVEMTRQLCNVLGPVDIL